MKNLDKKIQLLLALYFVFGLIFAFLFAYFYHWSSFSYFSPGFYVVILTWPYQALGFIPDFLTYGLAGKPI